MLTERKLDAMKHASQPRAAGLARTLGPQQRRNDVPRNGPLRLGKMDQQRETLAQVQLDRAVVAVDLRQTERLKREPSHKSFLALSAARGRAGDGAVIAATSDAEYGRSGRTMRTRKGPDHDPIYTAARAGRGRSLHRPSRYRPRRRVFRRDGQCGAQARPVSGDGRP